MSTPEWLPGAPDGVVAGLGALWGKSDAAGRPNLLIQHLLDTAAVAELLWDRFLAPSFCAQLDEVAGGRGRSLLTWLCGAHDLGKATPAFQNQDHSLGARVQSAGLTWDDYLAPNPNRSWRHERASARIVLDAVTGWASGSRSWIWPLLAGHHGLFPDSGDIRPPKRALHGTTPGWDAVQASLLEVVTRFSGYTDVADVEPTARPPRAVQLALSGFVIMADWIASDERHFDGVDDLSDVSPEGARGRAESGWEALGLRPGWRRLTASQAPIEERFSVPARPGQEAVVEIAATMPGPGLMVVEAPTGEGKTEAALAAAEILSARFGADGVFVGMPTQATSDPMLTRVGAWASQLKPGIPIALLHGKRLFNPEWRRLLERRGPPWPGHDALDEYGMADPSRSAPHPQGIDEGAPAAGEAAIAVEEWLLGRKRGLLAPVAVGTIDQLLFAATRTKHVAVRFAGLAGKVVILDEVHAADIYMAQFLREALWWFGECRIPVVLLSATLAPGQRTGLMEAYLRGALGAPHLNLDEPVAPGGYPCITAVWAEDSSPRLAIRTTAGWRPSRPVRVEIIDDDATDPAPSLVPFLSEATREGGCVLVLLNTVARAQNAYRALRDALEGEVVLVHGRLTAADRSARTERLLDLLGPPAPGRRRPARLVVVATQVAEQSFDVDVDLLVTDLAPVDLLVQRAGRLHRHDRAAMVRPGTLTEPRIVVTGMRRNTDGPPSIVGSALMIYGETGVAGGDSAAPERRTPYRAAAPLLRTAALVEQAAAGGGWLLPQDVPTLVAAAYGRDLVTPEGWQEAEQRELDAFDVLQERRAQRANAFRLAPVGTRTKATLEGIHGRAQNPADEEVLRAVVRDGPASVEVVLVERVGQRLRTVEENGQDLGLQGERINTEADPGIVLGGTVRFPPTFPDLTRAAEQLGPTLPEWLDHPWTKRAHVLVLEDGEAELDRYRIRYHRELGLIVEPRRATDESGTT